MIRNVCTVLKFHLVVLAQICNYSRVPQNMWDCVTDFEELEPFPRLLGRAYSLLEFSVSSRRKLGKG